MIIKRPSVVFGKTMVGPDGKIFSLGLKNIFGKKLGKIFFYRGLKAGK